MRRFLLSAAALLCTACHDNTGPTPRGAVGLGFQVARSSPAQVMAANVSSDANSVPGDEPVVTPSADGLLITRGDDMLLVTRAQVVVKDVKLERADATCVDDDDDFDDATLADRDKAREHASDDEDRCPTIHTGPFLVDVPVNGSDGAR